MSRLGRNAAETGNFLERVFPFLGVRFISIADGYDSTAANAGDALAVALKNLVNEAYSKVGIYCRLSVDDASNSAKARNYIPADESVSIENQWRFGMKCHVGVDAGTGYVHTLEVTPANIHDVTAASNLIRADDEVVYGDSGYLGGTPQPCSKES